MGDRNVGKGLSDHRDLVPADVLDRRRLEHAAGGRIEGARTVECGLFREKHVLRKEFALEARKILAQRGLAIGEFPMAGHGLDAKQIRGLDHVGAARRVGKARALPGIAAVEQKTTRWPRVAAQAIDQGFQMRKAAKLAESSGGFLKVEGSERVSVGAVGPDAEASEKSASDQMRRASRRFAGPEIDAGLAKIAGQKLRMGVGNMENARIAE